MSGLVAAVRNGVPPACQTSRCNKDGCSVSMKGASHPRVIVDMDCKALDIQSGSRCDYLFVSEDESSVWVALIELKSGEVKASEVGEQLQGGALFAQQLLSIGDQFNFVPVLAHKSIHRLERNKLRRVRIRLRGKTRQPVLIKCGDPVTKALATGT